MSYSIDIYRNSLKPTKSLLDFALFVGFFPQLVAGPIVRAKDFLQQLSTNNREPVQMGRATKLILGGLFKKIVIADLLATEIVDGVFRNPAGSTGLETLIGIYGYALQIYGDFSGYSDIAIGIALLLGFQFSDNFNQPYRALSLQDFWRRWHISLSSWLRDYLYIGLGGNRKGKMKTYRNLLLTMLLGGLWHGAAWTFVAWGLLHGGGLAIERAIDERSIEPVNQKPFRRFLRGFLTFHLVCAGWVFFRSVDMERAFEVFAALGNSWTSAPSMNWGIAAVLLIGLLMQTSTVGKFDRFWKQFSTLPAVLQGAVIAIAVVGMDLLGPDGVAPFIYFQF
jgi:D-alanyl-lipoteichoic acid acyltransferase DltB (MBOAT superfamily)